MNIVIKYLKEKENEISGIRAHTFDFFELVLDDSNVDQALYGFFYRLIDDEQSSPNAYDEKHKYIAVSKEDLVIALSEDMEDILSQAFWNY